MNQTYFNASATGLAWQTVADMGNSSIINRADIDVYVKLYAVSATKINDIRILPPIGGHWQVEKEEHYIYTKSIFYAPKKSVAAKLALGLSKNACAWFIQECLRLVHPRMLALGSSKKYSNKFNFVEFRPRSAKKLQAFLYIRSSKFGFSLALHYL